MGKKTKRSNIELDAELALSRGFGRATAIRAMRLSAELREMKYQISKRQRKNAKAKRRGKVDDKIYRSIVGGLKGTQREDRHMVSAVLKALEQRGISVSRKTVTDNLRRLGLKS